MQEHHECLRLFLFRIRLAVFPQKVRVDTIVNSRKAKPKVLLFSRQLTVDS